MLLGRETAVGSRISCTLRAVWGPRGSAGARRDFFPRLNGGVWDMLLGRETAGRELCCI
jgi:hypothetical protein